jgi:Trk-type K+ transport system membrane component
MQLWLRILRWLTRAGALAALASVIVEFGFGLPEGTLELVHALELSVVGMYAFNAVAHVLGAKDRARFLRENWLDAALLCLLATALGLVLIGQSSPLMTRLSFIAAQVLIVARMLVSLARTQERLLSPKMQPAKLLLLSFLFLIAIGSAALMMPRCLAPGARPLSIIEALFTATSAVCVTGLSLRDIGTELSFRGQLVLLVLIQIGGLGLVTIGTAITVIERSTPNLRFVAFASSLVGVRGFGALRRFLVYTLLLTVALELTGAAILTHALPADAQSLPQRLWWGLFHSVSAFCNAGFGLSSQSITPWAGATAIPLTIAALVVLGGLGFPVLIDLLRFEISTLRIFQSLRARLLHIAWLRWWSTRRLSLSWLRSPVSALQLPPASRLQANTKLLLLASAILLALGTLLFYLSERQGVLETATPGQSLLQSFFYSVVARTAGFNALDLQALALPTLLLTVVLMAIGASAVSTGGGMKVGTVAVVFLTVRAMMRDREHVEVFGRSLPARIVNAAIAVVALYLMAMVCVTMILAVTQPHIDFVDLLFESVSALSTVGLSHGVTAQLNDTGRLVIAAAMLLGRLGPLAVVWSFLARGKPLRYRYPEEDVVIS